MPRPAALFSAVLVLAPALLPAASPAPAPVDYNREVRPILSENCFSCHGPDEKGRKGKRRLDLAESAGADRNGIVAIRPGRPDESDVWLRILSADPEEVMPPPESHLALTVDQKQTLRRWIEEGAPYAPHWAFVAPRRPAVPTNSGGEAPVDAFIRARLRTEGLTPAPAADRATLIRRLSVDLTGLPPTPEEVRAFTSDADPQAYARLVDRLLASPHFGERWSLDWLDASRYADTNGFSIDGGRNQWLWRDWVIQALNDNLPYDRFLRDQLAGDLVPGRTEAQLVATGFQRNNMVTHEGGTIPEENLTNYNADRVKTLGEAVLGLTLACAQCHDHKYDPISQREYFQLFAFFNTLGDKGLDGNFGINPGPFVEARTVLRTDEVPGLERAIADLERRLATPEPGVLARWEQEQQERLVRRNAGLALHPLEVLKVSTPNKGSGFEPEAGNRVRIAPGFSLAAFDVSTRLPAIDRPITGVRVVFHPRPDLPGGGWGHGPALPRARAAKGGKGKAPEGPLLEGNASKGHFVLTAFGATPDTVPADQVNLHRLLPVSRVTASSWQSAYPPRASLDPRNDSGWAPSLDEQGPVHFTLTFREPVRSAATPYLTVQLNFGHGKDLVPGLFELWALTGEDDGTDLPPAVVAALGTAPAARTPAMQAALWAECAAAGGEFAGLRTDLANLRERLAVLTKPFPTMVMNVAEKPRETFILNRGDYAQPTVKVTPGTPAILPPFPAGASADRLGLAQWITAPDNPLTARVAVNRIWKGLFGQGLVATAADFGAQGEWPSHPELLDWLAVDFVEHGWDVKRMIRNLVLSDTYRQSSDTSPALLERDPRNRLLARGARFRLPAELIRDQALAMSGLLVPRVGGPSVNPYAPGDLWREVSHYGSTPATAQTFVQDHGEKLYRRSLYTFWKRTVPPPNLGVFDAPSREVCTVSRAQTTTPLQALVLLNDPQFVEAARVFGARMRAEGTDDAARLRWGFLAALAREPRAAEAKVLAEALGRERTRYAAQPAAAERLLAVGEAPRPAGVTPAEAAAWAQVGSLLLNVSETITRN